MVTNDGFGLVFEVSIRIRISAWVTRARETYGVGGQVKSVPGEGLSQKNFRFLFKNSVHFGSSRKLFEQHSLLFMRQNTLKKIFFGHCPSSYKAREARPTAPCFPRLCRISCQVYQTDRPIATIRLMHEGLFQSQI